MNVATLPTSDVFRTEPIRGLPANSRVDRDKRTIFGAKAMQIGPLNAGDDRPWKVDRVTLEQLQTLVNDRPTGTKMRFAHPNMSRDGMGKHLGRAKNAKIVGIGEDAFVSVDAELAATSNKQLGDHVLDLATEFPEDFGLSIAPLLDREAMDKCTPDAAGLVPIRIKSLRAIDFVDEPAATRGGLFELNSDSLADLPAQATDLLDRFFSDSPADVIRARFGDFLTMYLRTRGDREMTTSDKLGTEEDIKALQDDVAALKAEIAAMKEGEPKEPEELQPETSSQQKASDELQTRRQKVEIEALCKLANVDEATKKLIIEAGFSRAEAQSWLKDTGHLSLRNPPVTEGGNDLGDKKKTPDDKFGEEYDANGDIYIRQGLSRFDYINSRRIDEKLIPHQKPKAS